MTKFSSVFTSLFKQRFKIIMYTLLAEIGIILSIVIWRCLFTSKSIPFIVEHDVFSLLVFFTICADIFMIVFLALKHESVYTKATFRLIPIGEGLLYSANLLASILAMLFFMIGQGIISFVTMIPRLSQNIHSITDLFHNQLNIKHAQSFLTPQIAIDLVKIFLVIVIFCLAVAIIEWSIISLIHFSTVSAMLVVPRNNVKLIKAGLVVVFIFLTSKWVEISFSLISDIVNNLVSKTVHLMPILQIAAYFLVLALLTSMLNIFLLTHFVEPSDQRLPIV